MPQLSSSLVSWGKDDFSVVSSTPGGKDFTRVTAGRNHSLALTPIGSISAWGRDDHGQASSAPVGIGITEVSGGELHSTAVMIPDPPSLWTDLGGAAPGINGLPVLDVAGPLTAGSLFQDALSQGAPNSIMLFWLSFTSTPLNVLGGTVHAYPFMSVTGSLSGSLVWPAAIPPGIDMYLQFLIQDFSVPSQITLSNAMMATTP